MRHTARFAVACVGREIEMHLLFKEEMKERYRGVALSPVRYRELIVPRRLAWD